MTVFSLLAVSFVMKVVMVIFATCGVVLILVVLIQKGKGGGLSGAIGGGMAGGVLGADTKKPMTWFTMCLVCLFLFLAVIMAKFYKPSVSNFDTGQPQQGVVQPEPQQKPGPASTGQTGSGAESPGE